MEPPHSAWPPLPLRPGVSRRLGLWSLGVHGLALGVVWLLPWTITARLGLSAVVALSLAQALAGPVLGRLPWSVREAVWQADGSWLLSLASGRQHPARLLSSTYVSPALVVLRFRCGRWRSYSLVLLPDNLPASRLRRLRVRLRLAAPRIPEEAAPRP